MKLNDARRAMEADMERRRAIQDRETLKNFVVIGVILGRGADDPSPITLHAGISGTGAVTGIGFPRELANSLQDGLCKWIEKRIERALSIMNELGVEDA